MQLSSVPAIDEIEAVTETELRIVIPTYGFGSEVASVVL